MEVFSLWTFCPHRRLVFRTFYPFGCFVLPDILSLRTFCPTDIMSLAIISPDVFSSDILSLRTFYLRMFCLDTVQLWSSADNGHAQMPVWARESLAFQRAKAFYHVTLPSLHPSLCPYIRQSMRTVLYVYPPTIHSPYPSLCLTLYPPSLFIPPSIRECQMMRTDQIRIRPLFFRQMSTT